MKIKKFSQFESTDWQGPYEVLNIREGRISISIGGFKVDTSKLKVGYSYLFKIEGDKIVDISMSCVDLVILSKNDNGYKVLSIKRGHAPFEGYWANPGGNIDEGESPEDAAIRELEEETSLILSKERLDFVGVFSEEYRDPRNKNCISYAFRCILDEMPNNLKAGDDASELFWNDVSLDGEMNVKMAFDHANIIKKAVLKK